MQDVVYFLRTEVDINSLECSVQLISINGTTSIDVKKVEHLTECYSGKIYHDNNYSNYTSHCGVTIT